MLIFVNTKGVIISRIISHGFKLFSLELYFVIRFRNPLVSPVGSYKLLPYFLSPLTLSIFSYLGLNSKIHQSF